MVYESFHATKSAVYRGYELLQEYSNSDVPLSSAQQVLVDSYNEYAASQITPPTLWDRVGGTFDAGNRWMSDRSWVSLKGYDTNNILSPDNVFNATHNLMATVVNLVPQGLSAVGEFAHWTGIDTLPPTMGGVLGMSDDLARLAGGMAMVSRAKLGGTATNSGVTNIIARDAVNLDEFNRLK